jgi:5,10-methylenetetrahydrofolate reductase
MDSSPYAALLARTSGKQCLVYKCIADAQFDEWIETAHTSHGHSAINVVGRVSSAGEFQGPTIAEAMDKVNQTAALKFGCVCIGERHTLESAQARGKSYPTEHLNMIRKQKAGCQWFVSQAIYDIGPTIQLLKDYASLCRQEGVTPRKVILTFAPVSRTKTLNFIKWLGVNVPDDIEKSILEAERPVDKSIDILCDHLKVILLEW